MIRLLRWLIWGDGHLHKWRAYGIETKVFATNESDMPIAHEQSFQCEICGTIRRFRV